MSSPEIPDSPSPDDCSGSDLSVAVRSKEISKAVYCFKKTRNVWATYADLSIYYNDRYPLVPRKNGKSSPTDEESRIRNNCNTWNRLVVNGAKPGHDPLCIRKTEHAVCQRREGTTRWYRIEERLAARLQLGPPVVANKIHRGRKRTKPAKSKPSA